MLSILCSTLWGQAGGFSVGVFVGGMMMSGKHNYKREDVKPDKLKAWYLSYLKNKKYPLIESEANRANKVLENAFNKIKSAGSLADLESQATLLKRDLVGQLITTEGLRYFKSSDFKNKNVTVSSAADLAATQAAYDKPYDDAIGILGFQNATDLEYKTASGIFEKAEKDPDLRRIRAASLTELNTAASLGGPGFLNAVQDGTLKSAADLARLSTFQTAVLTYNASVKGPADQARLKAAGLDLVQAWVNEKIKTYFMGSVDTAINNVSEQLDDPLERALAAYLADKEVEPTADQYDPNNENKALTSPELGKEPGEQGKWETLEGEVKSKRIGLTYGFSVGYEKEMNKNHAFVGGNAFAKKDSLTIKYDLQVEKGNRASFGELEAKPGYTFGVTVVAGKHLNPVFSVFGRGTFEFTKWGFNYDTKKDSPSMENDRIATQKLGNWVKQAAVGVGARYNFAPLWSAEVCYDFIPATKTTVRDFNKLGDDGRRRGYIYTSSQHRAFLKVVRFFNM